MAEVGEEVKDATAKEEAKYFFRYDLLRIPIIRWLFKLRAYQFIAIFPNFLIFVALMYAAFFGSPVGNSNLAILIMWIVWWAALMLVLVPFGGRIWCQVCPIPALGEWIQRGTFVGVRHKPIGLGKRWPKKFDNIWIQNASFLMVSSFIGILVTRPWVSGILLIILVIILPIIVFLIFRGRAFCRYICPVSGFIGLYSMFSTLELRVKNRETCIKHVGYKDCIRGNDKGYGCPWFEYPGNLNRNAYCGLCTECIKTCPFDNIAVNFRIGGEDLFVDPWYGIKKRGLDEAYKTFIMATLAILYAIVFAGAHPWLREVSNVLGGKVAPLIGKAIHVPFDKKTNLLIEAFSLQNYLTFLGIILVSTLVIAPALFAAFAYLSKMLSGKDVSFKRVFINFSYALVPISLMAWGAFSIYILLVNGSYVLRILSDPFNLGWDIFGTAHLKWQPYFTWAIPYIQMAFIVAGVVFSTRAAHEISLRMFDDKKAAIRAAIPIVAAVLGYALIVIHVWLGGGVFL